MKLSQLDNGQLIMVYDDLANYIVMTVGEYLRDGKLCADGCALYTAELQHGELSAHTYISFLLSEPSCYMKENWFEEVTGKITEQDLQLIQSIIDRVLSPGVGYFPDEEIEVDF